MADDPLNTIQPNRCNLSAVWNFNSGCLQVNGYNVLTTNDGIVLTDAGAPNTYLRRNGSGVVQNSALLAADMPSAIDAAKIANGNVSNSEFQYLDGVTSSIQTQLNGKEPTITALPLNRGGTGATTQSGAANAVLPSQGGNGGKFLQTNGTDVSWQTPAGAAAPECIFSISAANDATAWGSNASAALTLLDNNTKLLVINGTNLEYKKCFGSSKAIPGSTTAQRAGQPVTGNVNCRVNYGGADYMLFAADGGATLYRVDSDGQNRQTMSFSGTAPTAMRRIGWDPVNNYVLIMDHTGKDGTQIRRYTISGTTLTNINNDIVLGTAPANAGSGMMYVGPTYIVLCDVVTATAPQFKRYDLNGVLIDTLTENIHAGNYLGMVVDATFHKLYLQLSMGLTVASDVCNFILYDVG